MRTITNGYYKHFKGEVYKVTDLAVHTENDEKLIIYHNVKNPDISHARPLDMFKGEVDRDKYPDVDQIYRFEEIPNYGVMKNHD